MDSPITNETLKERAVELVESGLTFAQAARKIKEEYPQMDGSGRSLRRWMEADSVYRKRMREARGIDPIYYADGDSLFSTAVVQSAFLRGLGRVWQNAETLARKVGCTVIQLEVIADDLRDSGYQVEHKGNKYRLSTASPAPAGVVQSIDLKKQWNSHWKIGLVSDTHISSTSERLDLLNLAYDCFADEGITSVYHCGNMIDGCKVGVNNHEVNFSGVTDQTMHMIDSYPYREGITTYYIDGLCHEGWYRKASGLHWGPYSQLMARDMGRYDLEYLGFLKADIELQAPMGYATVRLYHPGGGSTITISHKPQRIVQSIKPGGLPDVLLIGHYHKAYSICIDEVWVVGAGCIQNQTEWMEQNGIYPQLGFTILDIRLSDRGDVTGVCADWRPL